MTSTLLGSGKWVGNTLTVKEPAETGKRLPYQDGLRVRTYAWNAYVG